MIIRLRDIFRLPQLKNIRLAAGVKGLDRTLHWVHVADLPDAIAWVQGGELLFMTGVAIKDDANALARIVEECARKGVAGIVINIGPYIPKIPPHIVQLADSLAFPLCELPWEVKLVEVTKDICNHIISKQMEDKSIQDIIENILYGDNSNANYLMTRAALYDYDLGRSHRVMLIKVNELLDYTRADIFTENQVLDAKLRLQQIVNEVMRKEGRKALSMIRGDRIIILLPSDEGEKEKQKLEAIAGELVAAAKTRLNCGAINIGWGSSCAQLDQMKTSLDQAELALKVAQTSDSRQFFGYDNLGFLKILFNVRDRQQMDSFRQEILGELYAYDRKNSAQLVATLSTFLEGNEDYNRVADRLHIHRNTLKYRIKKIAEITGRDLNNAQDRMHLYFATVVNKFLDL